MGKIVFHNTNIQYSPDNKNGLKPDNSFLNNSDYSKKRNKEYLELFSTLDNKEYTTTAGWDSLMQLISEEFGTANISSMPLGIVSKCYLGHPYEVHILDLSESRIIEHYKIMDTMPLLFERARVLALHSEYCCVEVYKDKLILIREDGTAVKL